MLQFDRYYRVNRRDNLGDPEYWNRRFKDLDLRLSRNEDALEDLDDVANRLEQIGLDRLNQSITPLVQETQARLRSISNMFTALSLTTNTVGEGAMSFIVIESQRNTFAAVDYVSIRATADEQNGVVGRVVSYNNETGELIVQAEQAMGAGIFHEWKIAISSPPDLVHAGRFDNPHNVNALQVGAYTTAETDTALATLRDTLRGGVATARDTLKKISDIRDADVTALNNAIANKSDTGHVHDGRYYTKAEVDSGLAQSKMHGACRFILASATACLLHPHNGYHLMINGVPQPIPGDLYISNAGLGAWGTYYCYAVMSGPNMTLVWSTTPPGRGPYGTYIMQWNALYTLVGKVVTNGSAQFQCDPFMWGVRSWFNDQGFTIARSLPAERGTSSTGAVEITSEVRMNALLWDNEQVEFDITGQGRSATLGNAAYTGLMVNGVIQWWTCVIHYDSVHANRWHNISGSRPLTLYSGFPWFTIGGQSAGTAGTAMWGAGTTISASVKGFN